MPLTFDIYVPSCVCQPDVLVRWPPPLHGQQRGHGDGLVSAGPAAHEAAHVLLVPEQLRCRLTMFLMCTALQLAAGGTSAPISSSSSAVRRTCQHGLPEPSPTFNYSHPPLSRQPLPALRLIPIVLYVHRSIFINTQMECWGGWMSIWLKLQQTLYTKCISERVCFLFVFLWAALGPPVASCLTELTQQVLLMTTASLASVAGRCPTAGLSAPLESEH